MRSLKCVYDRELWQRQTCELETRAPRGLLSLAERLVHAGPVCQLPVELGARVADPKCLEPKLKEAQHIEPTAYLL